MLLPSIMGPKPMRRGHSPCFTGLSGLMSLGMHVTQESVSSSVCKAIATDDNLQQVS